MSSGPPTAPPSVSRYRSVRRAAALAQNASTQESATTSIPPVPPVPQQQFENVQTSKPVPASDSTSSAASDAVSQRTKTMSRYHQRPVTRNGTPPRPAGQLPSQSAQRQQTHSPPTGANQGGLHTAVMPRNPSIDTASSTTQTSVRTSGFRPANPPPPAIAPPAMHAQHWQGRVTQTMVAYPQQPMHHQPLQGQVSLYSQHPQTYVYNVPRADQSFDYPRTPIESFDLDPEVQARKFLEREAFRQQSMRQQQEEERIARHRKEREQREQKEAGKRHEEEALRKAEEERAAEQARHRLEQLEREAKRKQWEQEELKRAKAEEDKRRAEQENESKKTRARLQKAAGYMDSKLEQKISPLPSPSEKLNEKEKIFMFKRWRTDEEPRLSSDIRRPKFVGEEKPKDDLPTIKLTPGPIAPQIDAPVSAVNHGDRRVRVQFHDQSIMLPVKPTTSPLQLIRAAVTHLSTPMDPRNSMIKENFAKLGLTRTLRMYEHVRDVLNSWDSDDQHELTIDAYDSGKDTKLYATFAPTIKPTGGSWHMSFSQKRGKWDKRFITLNSEGQITAAKNETGKDSFNVCNISDFEIFRLNKETERKKIRPPKKYCYAVKSMQKSTMFLGDVGFVHFFCTSDESVAQEFYDAIFRWRSWYRVNTLGEGSQSSLGTSPGSLLTTSGSLSHKRNSSQTSHYVLGSFNTGLGFDPSSFRLSEDPARPPARHQRIPSDAPLASAVSAPSASEHSRAIHARQLSVRRAVANHPPLAFESKRNQSAVEAAAPAAGRGPQRSGSTRSSRGERPSPDGAPLRSPNLPPPLVDLTPQYVPPPQHLRKGRGFRPQGALAGGLVEAATGPEAPGRIVIPEAREWRTRGASVTSPKSGGASPNRTLLARTSSVKSQKDGAAGGRGLIGDLGGNEGFTGRGLLGDRLKMSLGSA